MPVVHFDVVANCTQANYAVSGLTSNINKLAGTSATASVAVAGVGSAMGDLDRVASARDGVGGPVVIALGTSGRSDAENDLRSVRAQVQGLSADIGSVSSVAPAVSGGAAIRTLTGDVGSLSQGLRGVSSSFSDTDVAAGRSARSVGALDQQVASASASMSNAANANASYASGMDDLGGRLGSVAGAHDGAAGAAERQASSVALLTDNMGGMSDAVQQGAHDMSAFENQFTASAGNVGKSAQKMSDNVAAARRVSTFGSLGAFGDATDAELERATGVPGTGHGPPPPRGGGGGGGRGGGAFGRAGGAGGDDAGSVLDTVGEVGQMGMMGAMIGGLATAATAAVGLGSVYETMKQMPVAFSAATDAVGQFDQGLSHTVALSSIYSDGGQIEQTAAAQMKGLGAVMDSLGSQVGHIGLDNMNTALSAATDFAGQLAPALNALQPAIAPAIKGLASLGDAAVQGFSSQGAVQAITGLGNTLADPKVEQGIAGLVSGAVTSGGVLGTVLANVAGAFGGSTTASPAMQSGLDGVMAGAMMGKGTWGKAAAGGIGGVLMAAGAFDQSQGIDPTAGFLSGGLGALGGSVLGKKYGGETGGRIGGIAGVLAGEGVTFGAQELDKRTGSDILGNALQTGFGAGMGTLMLTKNPLAAGAAGISAGIGEAGVEAQKEGKIGFVPSLMKMFGVPAKAADASFAPPGGGSGGSLPIPSEDKGLLPSGSAAASNTSVGAGGTFSGSRDADGNVKYSNTVNTPAGVGSSSYSSSPGGPSYSHSVMPSPGGGYLDTSSTQGAGGGTGTTTFGEDAYGNAIAPSYTFTPPGGTPQALPSQAGAASSAGAVPPATPVTAPTATGKDRGPTKPWSPASSSATGQDAARKAAAATAGGAPGSGLRDYSDFLGKLNVATPGPTAKLTALASATDKVNTSLAATPSAANSASQALPAASQGVGAGVNQNQAGGANAGLKKLEGAMGGTDASMTAGAASGGSAASPLKGLEDAASAGAPTSSGGGGGGGQWLPETPGIEQARQAAAIQGVKDTAHPTAAQMSALHSMADPGLRTGAFDTSIAYYGRAAAKTGIHTFATTGLAPGTEYGPNGKPLSYSELNAPLKGPTPTAPARSDPGDPYGSTAPGNPGYGKFGAPAAAASPGPVGAARANPTPTGTAVAPGMSSALSQVSQGLTGYTANALGAQRANESLAPSFHGINQAAQGQQQNQPAAHPQAQQNSALAQSSQAVAAGAAQAATGVGSMRGSLQNAITAAHGLSAAAPGAAQSARSAVAGATSALGGLSTAMGAAGAAGAASMASGISGGAGHAAAAAAAATHSATSASASAAGTQSPSTVTMQIGAWMSEGLAIGLGQGAPQAAGAAGALATSAVAAATNSVAQANFNETLAGGFGAGLSAASNGVTPIAQDYGLMIGSAWAQNVVTGAESVLQSSQFAALTTPQFGSQLAQANLGMQGLLPPAGAGAEYYTTTSGSAGMVSMAPVVNATINVTVDGAGPMQVISQQVVNASMANLANSIGAQSG